MIVGRNVNVHMDGANHKGAFKSEIRSNIWVLIVTPKQWKQEFSIIE